MNKELINCIAKKAGYTSPELTSRMHTFAELFYNEIAKVVAAQALLGESAVDVYANIEKIFAKPGIK